MRSSLLVFRHNRCTSADHPRSHRCRCDAGFETSIHFCTGVVNSVLGLETTDFGNLAQAARPCLSAAKGMRWLGPVVARVRNPRTAHALPNYVPCWTNRYHARAGCAYTNGIPAQRPVRGCWIFQKVFASTPYDLKASQAPP
jgi:hypothetical protein